MESKKVLVLVGSESDLPFIQPGIEEGFQGTGIEHELRIASEQRVPWMVKEYLNEHQYDGIIPCGGLSYILAGHIHYLIEELRDEKEFRVNPREYDSIDKVVKSKYCGIEHQIPVLGVPVRDRKTIGETPFQVMIQSPTYHIGAAVGVQKAKEAAQLMNQILNTEWSGVEIVTRDWHSNPQEGRGTTAYDIGKLIDTKFGIYDDSKVTWGVERFSSSWKKQENNLVIAVYNKGDIDMLEQLDHEGQLYIAVMNKGDYEVDFRRMVQDMKNINNAIHTRVGSAENAAMLAAQYLYLSHPELLERFRQVGREKSAPYINHYMENKPLNEIIANIFVKSKD